MLYAVTIYEGTGGVMRDKLKGVESKGIQDRMRICHVITDLGNGGAEVVLYRLCTHDKQNRHTVISLMDFDKYGALLEASGIAVYGLDMPRGRVTLTGLWRLWRLLRSEHPDVVQTWMYHADFIGGIMARLARIPIVCWGIRHSNLEPGKTARLTILIARVCARLSHWIPYAIVSCSAKAAAVHQALGYAPGKFTIIPNGYNIVEFTPDSEARAQLRHKWEINEQTILFGMVARYDPQKDHANLVNALRLINHKKESFKCVLVGAGMDANNHELCRLIENQGVRDKVLLLGERPDIPGVMNALDIHVLSSVGEAFPNVLAEAMACGTPCVTTDVGDAAVIVGDTGWVVPHSNSGLLANAISEAIAEMQDSEKWAVRKSMCRDRVVLNFSLERMVDNYHNVWRSFMSSSQDNLPNKDTSNCPDGAC
jgi:glycosyltransferase involved in cell wall biosynthesis